MFPAGVHLQNLQVGVEDLPVDVSSRPQTLYGVTRSVPPLCQLEASKCDGIYWQSNGINIMISISSAITFDKLVQVNSIYQPWCFYKDISHWLAFIGSGFSCVLTWLWLQMNDWKICCRDEVRRRQRHQSWVDGRWGHLEKNHYNSQIIKILDKYETLIYSQYMVGGVTWKIIIVKWLNTW